MEIQKKSRPLEVRKKISRAMMGAKNHFFGKHHSQKTKLKIRKALFGRHLSKETRIKMRKAQEAEKHPRWRGGKIRNSQGYVFVFNPDHPYAHKRHVREHRLIVERKIGRYLHRWEVVHHINSIKDDNRSKNLMAFTNDVAHRRFEKGGKIKPKEIIFDGRVTLCKP